MTYRKLANDVLAPDNDDDRDDAHLFVYMRVCMFARVDGQACVCTRVPNKRAR